jgi:5-methyltetrahydrofolate--homocysteine methyltransferase
MVFVAEEMERLGMNIPLLIGGATTSRAHTAVKISHVYNGPVVHVLDASRSVPVVSQLLSKTQKEDFVINIKKEYEDLREGYLSRKADKKMISLEQARGNKFQIDWNADEITKPNQLGVQVLDDVDLLTLSDYIDWTPFFQAWELHGRYPNILTDDVVGTEAVKLFNDAQNMLHTLIREKWFTAKAVFGIFEANAEGDDIIAAGERFLTLRQQGAKATGIPNIALSDFIAPKETGIQDYFGLFAVSILGTDEKAMTFKADMDDYNAIMVQALGDRYAEALAEYLHEQVRKNYWGYDTSEQLSAEDLIKESYRGIRPAPGYPACPDHNEKRTIWKVLEVEKNIGTTLTESLAMWPASSVSGMYFAHPQAKYFGLGKVEKDQAIDVAKRRGWDLKVVEKWLGSVLNY